MFKQFLVASVLVLSWHRSASAQEPSKPSIQQILSNQKIWGKDFPAALADVLALQKLGEHTVEVKSNAVNPTKQIEGANDLTEAILRMQQAVKIAPQYSEQVRSDLGCNKKSTPWCHWIVDSSQAVKESKGESGESMVVASSPGRQFLAPNVTVETVRKELGAPEKITQEVIQTEYERQPVIVTKYHYASDAFVFATSNMKPGGRLDHALVNADAVAQAPAGGTASEGKK